MKPSQEYLEPNDKTRHFGGLVVHRQKSPPNLAEWAVCANSYLQNAWFYKLVLCNFRTRSIAKNNISRNFSWLLIFRSCSFKNRRDIYIYIIVILLNVSLLQIRKTVADTRLAVLRCEYHFFPVQTTYITVLNSVYKQVFNARVT